MKNTKGFTLIELMIVVVVIGILGAVAYPSYVEYVMRSKLAEARAELSTMRVRLEQYFQDKRTYTGACVGGTVAPLPSPSQPNFVYSCTVLPALLTDTTYVVTATGTASAGTAGFQFTIDENNVRQTTQVPSNPSGWVTSTTCWVRAKGGVC
jgi:type IV pilus assembly protein PilE